jgi:hypothetical protein
MLFVADSTRARMRTTDELSLIGDFEVRGRVEKLTVWTVWPDTTNVEDRRQTPD